MVALPLYGVSKFEMDEENCHARSMSVVVARTCSTRLDVRCRRIELVLVFQRLLDRVLVSLLVLILIVCHRTISCGIDRSQVTTEIKNVAFNVHGWRKLVRMQDLCKCASRAAMPMAGIET